MSDAPNFQDYVAQERERLGDERRKIIDNIAYFTGLLDVVNRDLAAVDAYEAAKTGKPVRTNGARVISGLRDAVSHAQRARHGSRREAILQAVRGAPDGMSRGDLIQWFGFKGDRSGEMSISNALTALTKTGQLVREGGKYRRIAQLGDADHVSPATDSNLRVAAE